MKLNMVKKLSPMGNEMFLPCTEDDRRAQMRWPVDAVVQVDARLHRNAAKHRKLFAILNMSVANWPDAQQGRKPHDAGELLDTIKHAVGWTDPYYDLNGNKFLKPRSIDYATCDESEFNEFYTLVVGLVSAILGCDPSILEQNTHSY